MSRYDLYKKVDLIWLDEIPKHWSLIKVKNIFEISNDLSHKENPTVLSLARDRIKIRNISNNEGQLAESYNNYNSVEVGDLLLNPMDLYSGANCNISQYSGVISPAYINLRTKQKICVKYFDYIFKKQYTSFAFQAVGKGVSLNNRWTLSNYTLLNYLIPIPPFSEQEHIANYLDWKIREIDKLIEIEKQQIEDIERLKKIMISQYYIELPIKRRIKTLIQSPLVYGINEAGKMNGKIRFVRITDIEKNGSLKKDGKQYINDCEKKYILEKGDILFARSGGTVGKTYIHQDISNNELMAFAGYLIRARFDINLVNPEYIYYYTQSESYTEWKNSIFIQSTIQNISAEKYSNLEIPYCSLNIQNKIVDKIKQKLLEINKLKEKSLEKQLYLVSLKESIISEVVTGQIDVRNIKIPESK